MACARFLFLSGTSWATGSASDRRGEPWYSWRLVGANNRPLASSAAVHPSLAECQLRVRGLVADLATGRVRLLADLDTGLWSWCFDVDEEVAAVSARSYQRQRECRDNGIGFLAAVPGAQHGTQVQVLPRGREHLRAASAGPDYRGLRRSLSLH
jgi:hypothetical protein